MPSGEASQLNAPYVIEWLDCLKTQSILCQVTANNEGFNGKLFGDACSSMWIGIERVRGQWLFINVSWVKSCKRKFFFPQIAPSQLVWETHLKKNALNCEINFRLKRNNGIVKVFRTLLHKKIEKEQELRGRERGHTHEGTGTRISFVAREWQLDIVESDMKGQGGVSSDELPLVEAIIGLFILSLPLWRSPNCLRKRVEKFVLWIFPSKVTVCMFLCLPVRDAAGPLCTL